MKARWCVNFLGACLLLASFSISTAEQRNIRSLKHDNFHQESFNVKLSDAEQKPQQHAVLYKTGSKELALAGQPFAKYAIQCSENTDCPSSSICGDNKVCWCSGDSGLRTIGSPKCIDLEYPCENLKFPPCHPDARCLYVFKKSFFGCKCTKKLFGNGLECKKKESVKTTTSTTTKATRPTPVTKESDPEGVIRLFEKKAKSFYNKVFHLIMKHLTFVILGGVGFVLVLLFITCCCCRRCIRKRREKRLLDSQDDESYYEQQQFSSYPAQDPRGNYYMDAQYQDVPMDDYLGPLPSIPDAPLPPPPPGGVSAPPPAAASPPAAAPPPPPPPPPPPLSAGGYRPKGHKTVSQSSFYSDDEN